jgi:hypothetical protein
MILPAPKHGTARGENRCVSSDRGVAADWPPIIAMYLLSTRFGALAMNNPPLL